MAPHTRSSMGVGVAKNVNRKTTRNTNRSLVSSQHDLMSQQSRQEDTIQTMGDVRALDQLQDVADRVGREVDTFAETLDEYLEHLRSDDPYEAAHALCVAYQEHGHEMVDTLKKKQQMQKMQNTRDNYQSRGQQSLHRTRNSRSDSIGSEDTAINHELKRWEAESATWELFRVVLELRYDPDRPSVKKQPQGPQHQYESHADAFERFLISDDVARERYAVLKWLETSATDATKDDSSDNDKRKSIVQRTNGWMQTRETIKAAKRIQARQTLDLDLRRSDDRDLLCTQLDPDAPLRQKRTLEKSDIEYERSMWQECYLKLRQGVAWSDVAAWCTQRNQQWRALSIGAFAGNNDQNHSNVSMTSGLLWRHMCLLATRAANADPYEAAAYGLLSGDLDAMLKVASCWDDNVYAHLNHSFIARYNDHIMQNYNYRLPAEYMTRMGLLARDTADEQMMEKKLFAKLSVDTATATEAKSAFKQIQTALIQNSISHLCEKVGEGMSTAQNTGARNEGASSIVQNTHALRTFAHLLRILAFLQESAAQANFVEAADEITAAYIQVLRRSGKRDLTPLYAAGMSKTRGETALAQVLSDIDDGKESMEFITLLKVFSIDVIAVLDGQYQYILRKLDGPGRQDFSMLEDTKQELYPGRCIRLDCVSSHISDDEEGLIGSLQVFYSVEGQWKMTFKALAHALRQLLVQGRVDAALALVSKMQYSEVSLSKTQHVLGHALDVMDPLKAAAYAVDDDRALQIQVLQAQSKAYYDMSQLVHAIEKLVTWRHVEYEHANKVPRPSSVPSKVRRSFEEVVNAVEQIMLGVLDDVKGTDEEVADYASIRQVYIPEIILAYNTVLCTAGHMISRDELLRSMDLATIVADEQRGLTDVFVKAGRVREMLDSFAETGKIMLKLNETGKAKKEKRGGMGKTLAIWEINGPA